MEKKIFGRTVEELYEVIEELQSRTDVNSTQMPSFDGETYNCDTEAFLAAWKKGSEALHKNRQFAELLNNFGTGWTD